MDAENSNCCICHNDDTFVKQHKGDVEAIVTEVKEQRTSWWSEKTITKFKEKNFDSVFDAGEDNDININYLENKFKTNFSDRNKDVLCFPPGIECYDRRLHSWVDEQKQMVEVSNNHSDVSITLSRKREVHRRMGYVKDVIGKLGEDFTCKAIFNAAQGAPSLLVSNFELKQHIKKYKTLSEVNQAIHAILPC